MWSVKSNATCQSCIAAHQGLNEQLGFIAYLGITKMSIFPLSGRIMWLMNGVCCDGSQALTQVWLTMLPINALTLMAGMCSVLRFVHSDLKVDHCVQWSLILTCCLPKEKCVMLVISNSEGTALCLPEPILFYDYGFLSCRCFLSFPFENGCYFVPQVVIKGFSIIDTEKRECK